MPYTVAQNTSFLTAASILQRVVSFAYFVIIARTIAVAYTGEYFFAISFATIFAVVADFGFNQVLTREATKNAPAGHLYFRALLWVKIVLSVATYGLIIVVSRLLNYPTSLQTLVALAGITMFLDNIHTVCYAFFRAQRNILYEAIGTFGSQIVTFIIGTVALLAGWPLYWLILAYTLASLANVIFSMTIARLVFHLSAKPLFDKKLMLIFFKLALPFAIAGIVARLYSSMDALLISKLLVGSDYLGWWLVAFKITFAFQFIPIALSASIYPVMSALHLSSAAEISALFVKSYRYLLIIVLPLSGGFIALAYPFIVRVYTNKFLPSVPLLQILMISLVFTFLSFVNGALLNAINRQRVQTIVFTVTLLINIILNVLLISRFALRGAAWGDLLSAIFLWVVGFWFVNRYVKIPLRPLAGYAGRVLVAVVVMTALLSILVTRINFILAIPMGIVCYIAMLFATGGLTMEMLRDWRSKFIYSDYP